MNTRGGPSTGLRRLLGLLLIAVILGFLTLTVASYNKAFTPVVAVKVKTDKAGNQLLPRADVKVHGVLVGEVSDIKGETDGAELSLQIQPEMAKMLPANVQVQLLPRTLFGDRYVSLIVPQQRSGTVLADGDRISQDRSKRATELDEALTNLMPVLQAVQPQKLSATLNAVSTALHGRGKQLGATLTQLGDYVGKLNPQLPTISHDLRALAKVSRTYSDVTPDLAHALQDLTVTSKTVAGQRQNLNSLYASLTGTANNLRSFLAANQDNLIKVGKLSKPTLNSLARYAPEFPCLFKGIADVVPRADAAFGKGKEPGLHLTLEVVTNRGKYEPGKDDPAYGEDRGPQCYHQPLGGTPFPQYPGGPIKDGSTPQPAASSGGMPSILGGAGGTTSPQSAGSVLNGLANSSGEQQMVAQLVGAHLGRDPKDVPSWASMLVGPLFRGSEVTLK